MGADNALEAVVALDAAFAALAAASVACSSAGKQDKSSCISEVEGCVVTATA